MNFIDRVKAILTENHKLKLKKLDEDIKKNEDIISAKKAEIMSINQKIAEIEDKEKSKKSKILSESNIIYYKNLSKFLDNLEKIRNITNAIFESEKDMEKLEKLSKKNGNERGLDDINLRIEIANEYSKLNKKVLDIKAGRYKKEDTETRILRLLTKKSEDKKLQFNLLFENIIENFNESIDCFCLENNYEDYKELMANIITKYNSLSRKQNTKKRFKTMLSEDEIDFLEEMNPIEYFKEIQNILGNIDYHVQIVESINNNLDYYKDLYFKDPNLFELENLKAFIEENNKKIEELKKLQLEKSKLKIKKTKNEKDIKSKEKILDDIDKKKKKENSAIENIMSKSTLNELNFKNKEEAAKKLSIVDTKDYIIIPIQSGVKSMDELLKMPTYVTIKMDGVSFKTEYVSNLISGKINCLEDDKNLGAAILIPIKNINPKDIAYIRQNRVFLNSSAINTKNSLVFIPDYLDFKCNNSNLNIRRVKIGNIMQNIQEFLGIDYTVSGEDAKNFDVFKGKGDNLIKEEEIKRNAIINAIYRNIGDKINCEDEILVDDARYHIPRNFLTQNKLDKKINNDFLRNYNENIIQELQNNSLSGVKVDKYYQDLLLEYLRINDKSKKSYLSEYDTKVKIHNKEYSIKPALPSNNLKIAKHYSRNDEDICYKIFKLAQLTNKFAHLVSDEKLEKDLFELKASLIENVIDLSKENSSIKIKRNFDNMQMATSVSLEIPGYNTISLHLINHSFDLSKKLKELNNNESDVMLGTTIQIPGINKDLLLAIKKMSMEERTKFISNMDKKVLTKFIIRAGYNTEKLLSINNKKDFYKELVSDENLDKLVEQGEELER